MLAVRADVADQLAKLASSKGFTLYALVNDVLSSYVSLAERALTMDQVLEAHHRLSVAKEMGFLTVPADLWFEAVDMAFLRNPDLLTNSWFEAGARCAKLYLVRGKENPLISFLDDLDSLGPDEIEFDVEQREGHLTVRCIGRQLSRSHTALLSFFLEGAFSMLGYGDPHKDVSAGALSLVLNPKPPDPNPGLPGRTPGGAPRPTGSASG